MTLNELTEYEKAHWELPRRAEIEVRNG